MNIFLSRELFRKFRRSFGILIVCVVGSAGLIFSASAHAAACTITMSPTAINFGTVTVPRDAAVGTPIGPVQTSSGSWSCPANPGTGNPNDIGNKSGFQLTVDGNYQRGGNNAWRTHMDGIGVKVLDTSYPNKWLSDTPLHYWDVTVPTNQTMWDTVTNNTSSGILTLTYQLVVIGKVTTGLLDTTLFFLGYHNVATGVSYLYEIPISVTATIVASTCMVTTPSINLTLPTVKASLLSPVGTTAGNTAFSIGLSCQTGANVYVTLTDATDPGNTTSNLTLASGSTATGVQLRLLKSGGTPVSYGPDSADAGNQNQWLVGASASTTNIPLTVQYISTGTVGAGMVKGLATFTMSYQ